MEKITLLNKLMNAGICIKNISEEALLEIIDDERKAAKYRQRENDIIEVIIMLSDMEKKDEELYEILSKYWNIDSRREASEYISIGRHVEWPYRRLKEYLKSEGLSSLEMIKYMKDNDVRKKLSNNSLLCELPEKKLKSEIDKL